MRPLLFIILAGYAVRCNDASYYVIEMPDVTSRQHSKQFKVYWNVPTTQCRSKRIPFNDLFSKFGIIQNSGDSFRGEEVSIMYDPGLFPALLKNETSGKFVFRNGGVPQEGDLEKHLFAFKNTLEQSVPDENFGGVGIIDFESWRPVFRQNFGVLIPYKDISYQIERKLHWFWSERAIQARARERFEEAGRAFMQTTLSIAKQLRPRALWGYYGFPYCFNMASNNMVETCSDKVKQENDKTYWLWSESTALYPSIYSSKDLTTSQLIQLVRGRVTEAQRVARRGTPVLPYFWFRYRDGGFLSKTDLNAVLETLYKSNASGFIIWGSSNDVNTVDKCNRLYQYTEEVMGPAIAKYTQGSQSPTSTTVSNFGLTTWRPILRDHLHNSTTSKPTLDPEYHWVPPENYTQDIVHYVEQEFKKKPGYNTTDIHKDTDENVHDNLEHNLLINMILDIFKDEKEDIENTGDKDVIVNENTNQNEVSDDTTIFSTQTYYIEPNTSTSTVPNIVTQNPLISLLLKDRKKGRIPNSEDDKLDEISTTKFDSATVTTLKPQSTRGYIYYTEKNNESSEYMTKSSINYQENMITTTEQNQVTDNEEILSYDLEAQANVSSVIPYSQENITSTTEPNTDTENEDKILEELLEISSNISVIRIERSTEVSNLSFDNRDSTTDSNPISDKFEVGYTSQDYADVPLDKVKNTLSTISDTYLISKDILNNTSDFIETSSLKATDTTLGDLKIALKVNLTKNQKKGHAKEDRKDTSSSLRSSTISPYSSTTIYPIVTESTTIDFRDIAYEDTEKFITDSIEMKEFISLGVNINNKVNAKDRKKGVGLSSHIQSTNNGSNISIDLQELKSTTEETELSESEVPDVEKEGFRIEGETTTDAQEVVFL